MQATDCPYCAVQVPDGAEICAICKHPVPAAIRREGSRTGRAPHPSGTVRPPREQAPGWNVLAGGAALFLAMVGVTLALALM